MPDPFPTTRWSLVLRVGDNTTSSARDALAALCELYWFPLYAYVRRRGHDHDDAHDLVQGYFADLLERRSIRAVQPEAGRFRAFLLHTMKHFLINAGHREQAQKRGGGRTPLRLDSDTAAGRYDALLVDSHTPEREFDRQWAMTVVDRVLERLESDAERDGRLDDFRKLKPFLTEGSERGEYAALAAEKGVSEGAIKVAVHRLRKRFGRCLREEIAETVNDAAEIEAEIRYLFTALNP